MNSSEEDSLVDVFLESVAQNEQIGEACGAPVGAKHGVVELNITVGHKAYRRHVKRVVSALREAGKTAVNDAAAYREGGRRVRALFSGSTCICSSARRARSSAVNTGS